MTPSISGKVFKKYDGTTSVANASSNTLEITLDGILDADKGKVTAAAEFAYADEKVGTSKLVQASNIVLSGDAAVHYVLSASTASANAGTIEQTSSSSGSSSGGSWGGSYYPASPATGGNSTGTAPGKNDLANTPAENASEKTVTETKTNPDGSVTTTATTTSPEGKVTKIVETTTEQIDASTTKVTEKVTTDAGTEITETVTEKKADGSIVQTETKTSTDSKVTKTQTTSKADVSVEKAVSETGTNSKGKETAVTTTTQTNAAGTVTSVKKETVITAAASNTSVSVTVKENGAGSVTSAVASVERTISGGTKAMLTGNIVSQITEAAGQEPVMITMTVKDTSGKRKYQVRVNSKDLSVGNSLYIYELDPSSGEYIMTDAKTYTVNQSGSVSVSMKENQTYQLVTASQAETINEAILKTVAVKKKAVTVKKGKSTTASLSSKLNMKNVKKAVYSSSKNTVAAVNEKGKITAKKVGTAAIKIKITLKNGLKKTVSMKVTVK